MGKQNPSVNKTRIAVVLGLVITMLAIAGVALAENEYPGGIGQIPEPFFNSRNISLNAAVISITMHEDLAEVQSAYRFKNPEETVTADMAVKDAGLVNFRAYSEGKEQTVTALNIKRQTGGAQGRYLVQNVVFAPRQEKIIVNRYLINYGGKVSPAESFLTLYEHIMHTGTGWKGPIGTAKIIVRFGAGMSWDSFIASTKAYRAINYSIPKSFNIQPQGFKKKEDGFEWTFNNYEPKKDEADVAVAFFRNLEAKAAQQGNISANSYFSNAQASFPAALAADGNILTAWGSGTNSGQKPMLTFNFDTGKEIAEICLIPGFVKDAGLFNSYARPKDITVRFSNGKRQSFTLSDEPYVHTISLDDTVTASSATITINSVYPGSKSQSVFLTETSFKSTRTIFMPGAATILSRISSESVNPNYVRMRPRQSSANRLMASAYQAVATAVNTKAVNIVVVAFAILGILMLMGTKSGMENEPTGAQSDEQQTTEPTA